MKLKLVEDAHKAWSWLSMQAMMLAGALQLAWAGLPADMRDALPRYLVTALTVLVLVLGMVGRLIKQEPGAGDARKDQ